MNVRGEAILITVLEDWSFSKCKACQDTARECRGGKRSEELMGVRSCRLSILLEPDAEARGPVGPASLVGGGKNLGSTGARTKQWSSCH